MGSGTFFGQPARPGEDARAENTYLTPSAAPKGSGTFFGGSVPATPSRLAAEKRARPRPVNGDAPVLGAGWLTDNQIG